ncbi:hypothetical protein Tco_1132518 [Tanacetum coccineum]|uniref:Retrovirus-related Pol polyprotein from transposon TNT 1-94-like beta-barrel domain-containing protein n=1 Tax=Tanacetum coccineum TaxID=301880 RepID=A0ABQ5JC56_9ASTR
MAHSNEVLSNNIYYRSSSLDNGSRENEYDKLGQISLRIINKNKHLKAKNESLKKTINELKTKLDILEKGKETSSNCDACSELRLEVNSLKLKLASFEYSSSSLQKMVEMQKSSKDKCGLGYTETIASSRNTKTKNLGGHLKNLSVEPAGRCHSSTTLACSIEQHRVHQKVKLDPDEWIQDSGCTRHMTGNKDLFSSYKTFDGGKVLFGSNTKSKIISKVHHFLLFSFTPTSLVLPFFTMPKENKTNLKRTRRISVRPCCFVNPKTSSPPYQPFSPPLDYTSGAPPTPPITTPPLSPINTIINSNKNYLLTPKSTPPLLTSPPPAPTQPSKLISSVTINLDPIELLFYTPPSSPSFLDLLGDLPPSTTNPSPPRPSFATIECLENEPPPIPPMDSTFPSPTPELEPTLPLLPPQCLPNPPS